MARLYNRLNQAFDASEVRSFVFENSQTGAFSVSARGLAAGVEVAGAIDFCDDPLHDGTDEYFANTHSESLAVDGEITSNVQIADVGALFVRIKITAAVGHVDGDAIDITVTDK